MTRSSLFLLTVNLQFLIIFFWLKKVLDVLTFNQFFLNIFFQGRILVMSTTRTYCSLKANRLALFNLVFLESIQDSGFYLKNSKLLKKTSFYLNSNENLNEHRRKFLFQTHPWGTENLCLSFLYLCNLKV